MSTAQRSTDRRRSPDMYRSASAFGLSVAAAGLLAMGVSVRQTWWVFEHIARLGHVAAGGAALAVEITTGMFAALTPLAAGRDWRIRCYVWLWFSLFVCVPIFCNWLHSVYDSGLTPLDLAGHHVLFDESGFPAGSLVGEHLATIRLALACIVPITGAIGLHAYSFRKRHGIGQDTAAVVPTRPAADRPTLSVRLRSAAAAVLALGRRLAPAVTAAAMLTAAVLAAGAAGLLADAVGGATLHNPPLTHVAAVLTGVIAAWAVLAQLRAVVRSRRAGRPAEHLDSEPAAVPQAPERPAEQQREPELPAQKPERPKPTGRPSATRSSAPHPTQADARRLYDGMVRKAPGEQPNAARLRAELAAQLGVAEDSPDLPSAPSVRRWVGDWWRAEPAVRAVG